MHPHPHLSRSTASFRVSRRRRWALGLCFALLLSTGIVWLAAHWLLMDTPEVQAPWAAWSMRLHAAGSWMAVFLLGVLWPTHVRNAWIRHHNRLAGGILFAFALALVLTGYGLYYFNGESLRGVTEWLHWIAGGVIGLLFWAHQRAGRRQRLHGRS